MLIAFIETGVTGVKTDVGGDQERSVAVSKDGAVLGKKFRGPCIEKMRVVKDC